MNRRYLHLSLILMVMILIISACGPAAANIETPTAVAPTANPKPFEGYQMHIIMEAVPETDYIISLLPQFEQQTGMKVNVEVVNFNVMYDKFIAQLTGPGGSGTDDVMQVSNEWTEQFAKAGWFLPLDDYLAKSAKVSKDPYVPAIWDGLNTYGNNVLYIPFYQWSMGWIYRNDMMTDPDLATEYQAKYNRLLNVPSTVQELLEWQNFMTREYKGAQVYGNVLQGTSPQNVPEFLLYLWGNNCDLDQIEQPCGIDAINYYKEAFSNAPPGTPGMQFDQVNEVFVQGKVASTIGYLWQQGTFEEDGSAAQGKTKLTTFPNNKSFLGAWGWGIPKSAPNPAAGWAFIEWVESAEITRARAEEGGEPSRMDLLTDPELLKTHPEYPAHLAILENARPYPKPLRTEAALDVVGRSVSRVVTGEITAEECAKTIADYIKANPNN